MIRLYLSILRINKIIGKQGDQMKFSESLTGPKYFGTSEKKSWIDSAIKRGPGPADHNPHFDKKRSPEWKVGDDSNRQTFLQPHRAQIPSPHHYHINHHSIEKQPKKFSIPQGKIQSKLSDTLGFLYTPNHNMPKTQYPHFSFGYSFQNDYSTITPGAGTYNAKIIKPTLNKTQSGFTNSQRPPPYGQQAKFPGATKYISTNRETTSKISFSKANRSQTRSNDPPSVFYDIGGKKKVIRTTRGESTEYRRECQLFIPNEYPAPNAYNPQAIQKIPKGIMQKSKRVPLEDTAIVSNPSPDKYAQHQELKNEKIGLSFPKQVRKLSVEQRKIPGVGQYDLLPALSKLGGAIGKEENALLEKPVFPDAALYSPRDMIVRRKAQSSIVLKADRIDFSKTITGQLGPGAYNTISQSSGIELGKVGRAPRGPLLSPNKDIPGVGNYTLPSYIGQLPKYCTSPKKISDQGYSIIHEKLKLRMKLKQRKSNILAQQKQKDNGMNPEQVPKSSLEL